MFSLFNSKHQIKNLSQIFISVCNEVSLLLTSTNRNIGSNSKLSKVLLTHCFRFISTLSSRYETKLSTVLCWYLVVKDTDITVTTFCRIIHLKHSDYNNMSSQYYKSITFHVFINVYKFSPYGHYSVTLISSP